MKKNKSQCPYRENSKCSHKDKEINKKGFKRSCGYIKSPESCPLFLEWVEVIDMEFLEKESLRDALELELGIPEI